MKHLANPEYYRFEIDIRKEVAGPLNRYILKVGSDEQPCLHAIIPLKPDRNNNIERFYNFIKYATLPNIDALHECLYEDVSEEYFRKHSFGKEMLQSVIRIIKNISEFKHITHIQLTDKSYIPCNRALNDTLDLITYSIALYGQTWYESNFSAIQYPEMNETRVKLLKDYDEAIKEYTSTITKEALLFNELYVYISVKNEYATKHVTDNLAKIQKMYDDAKILPEFFITLSKSLEPTNKCRFFKTWLEHFIAERIPINRTWYIPIKRMTGSGRRTRKAKHIA